MCLVFEPLGKSLYDFIKDNGYKGFEISQVREIAIQALNAIEFLHSLKLTHTDLKPENILLKSDNKETFTDEAQFPIVSLISLIHLQNYYYDSNKLLSLLIDIASSE